MFWTIYYTRSATDAATVNGENILLSSCKPELNSWEDLSSFNHLDLRYSLCIATNDNFIYFIGGVEWCCNNFKFLCDVDRYDLNKNQWEKVADIQMARDRIMGAAVSKKIYIVGEAHAPPMLPTPRDEWEVYDETTNEWQFIRASETDWGAV